MGRAFELRKERRNKRFDKMAKAFTRLAKDIVIAVKSGGGPDIDNNSRLRVLVQNAKGLNMPKDRIDAAIKRAVSREEKDYEEMVYEGYGPHGVAILIETATDNTNRTVANVRSYFAKHDGALGKTGSLDFVFERKSVFRIKAENVNMDDLELELIDLGLDELFEDEGEINIYAAFESFGAVQKYFDENNIEVINASLQRLPLSSVSVTEEQEEEVMKIIEKLEDDEDVQAVYYNIG